MNKLDLLNRERFRLSIRKDYALKWIESSTNPIQVLNVGDWWHSTYIRSKEFLERNGFSNNIRYLVELETFMTDYDIYTDVIRNAKYSKIETF